MTGSWWCECDALEVDWRFKGFGPAHQSCTISQLVDAGITVAELARPVMTLHADAVEHNISLMDAWTTRHGVGLAPHGKTSMAPALWKRQIEAGATAITVSTGWQLRVAIEAGIQHIQHAGALLDRDELRYLGSALRRNPDLEVIVWVDSPRAAEITADGYPSDGRPLAVLVDRGSRGSRTGARTLETALDTAMAVAAASNLFLYGVAAWEGSLSPDDAAEKWSLEDLRGAVSLFCDEVAETFVSIQDAGLFPRDHTPVITAGGSKFFDIVVARWARLIAGPNPRARIILRSGCYVTHDDGDYASSSPLRRGNVAEGLTAALHVWAEVVSRPEPGLALLNAGRRDVPYDGGLPRPLRAFDPRGRPLVGAVDGAAVTAVNDQHCYLTVSSESSLGVGDIVQLGISHPCTAFDKWVLIPVVREAGYDTPRVIGALRTWF